MALLELVKNYENIINAVIQPPRQNYTLNDLGPRDMCIHKTKFRRTDLKLRNRRGYLIECSHFEAQNQKNPAPCIIYLHANGCSRLESMDYLEMIASNGMNLFCFDFSGSGLSEGPHCSLGWFEQEDLECVIEYLTTTGRASKIGVWGRSMGAITALLYAKRDPRIACLVLDSPFMSFKQFAKEFARGRGSIPDFLTLAALAVLRSSVKSRANFDINHLDPFKEAPLIKIPAFFAAAHDDTFVHPKHSLQLYETYGGIKKKHTNFSGDHNSMRPQKLLVQIIEFLTQNVCSPVNDKKISSPTKKPKSKPIHSTGQLGPSEIFKGTRSPVKKERKSPSKRSQICATENITSKKIFDEHIQKTLGFTRVNDQEFETQQNCLKGIPVSHGPLSGRRMTEEVQIHSHFEEIPTEDSPNTPNRTSVTSTAAEISSKSNLQITEGNSSGPTDEYFEGAILNSSVSLKSLSSKSGIQMPKEFFARKSSLNPLIYDEISARQPKVTRVSSSEVPLKPKQKIIGIIKSQQGAQTAEKPLNQQINPSGSNGATFLSSSASINCGEKAKILTEIQRELKPNYLLQKILGAEPVVQNETTKQIVIEQEFKYKVPLQELRSNAKVSQPIQQKVSTSLIMPPEIKTNPSMFTQKLQGEKIWHSLLKDISLNNIPRKYSPETYIPGMFNQLASQKQENNTARMKHDFLANSEFSNVPAFLPTQSNSFGPKITQNKENLVDNC